jgi:hypothetical protein
MGGYNKLTVGPITATGTGAADITYTNVANLLPIGRGFSGIEAQLRTAADAGEATTPTMDVLLEASLDGGTNWFTLLTFTQATDATVEKKAAIRTASAFLGDCYRIKSSVGSASGTASFTHYVDLLFYDI